MRDAVERWFRPAPTPQIPLRVIVHSDGIVVHPERPVAFRGPIARTGLALTIDGYVRALLGARSIEQKTIELGGAPKRL
jgi:hypothetical protein